MSSAAAEAGEVERSRVSLRVGSSTQVTHGARVSAKLCTGTKGAVAQP